MLGRSILTHSIFTKSIMTHARATAARLSARLARRTTPAATVLPDLQARPAPMRPLRPPAAVNDNPLAGLEAEVERDLRTKGYLR